MISTFWVELSGWAQCLWNTQIKCTNETEFKSSWICHYVCSVKKQSWSRFETGWFNHVNTKMKYIKVKKRESLVVHSMFIYVHLCYNIFGFCETFAFTESFMDKFKCCTYRFPEPNVASMYYWSNCRSLVSAYQYFNAEVLFW